MNGYVAVTDPGWYENLCRDRGPKDANFWRPSARPVSLEEGTPFFFKLKAPYHAIAGFGYFSGFTILPDWLAWDIFGEANGVTGPEELRARLGQLRKTSGIQADPLGRIGCCLIAEAVFFRPDEWVTPPRDWQPAIQVGKKYDLSHGEGLRIWMECQARSADVRGALIAADSEQRYGSPQLRIPRVGQGIFRVKVLDAYGRACAVTQEHSLPVLEAAHIKPYSAGGDHRVSNGLSLRSDLHRLFDRGYVTVDEDYRFVVGERLKLDFENGRSYLGLKGQRLALPANPSLRPDPAALDWHRNEVFLG